MLRFFTFSQQNAPSLQIYITIPKTFGFVKKSSRNKHHFQIFFRLFFFPSRNFSFTNMQPSKNFGFIEAKQLKNEEKKHIYLINIIHKCLKMYKLHYLI